MIETVLMSSFLSLLILFLSVTVKTGDPVRDESGPDEGNMTALIALSCRRGSVTHQTPISLQHLCPSP